MPTAFFCKEKNFSVEQRDNGDISGSSIRKVFHIPRETSCGCEGGTSNVKAKWLEFEWGLSVTFLPIWYTIDLVAN